MCEHIRATFGLPVFSEAEHTALFRFPARRFKNGCEVIDTS